LDRVYQRLASEPYSFDFFQACRLLGRLRRDFAPAGLDEQPTEPARFAAHLSLNYPASQIHSLAHGNTPGDPATMTVTFMGLFGPKGVMPWHYTQKLIDREHARSKEWERLTDAQRDQYQAERPAARAWLDLFNHRFVYLFYRAWDKYRFWLAYERFEPEMVDPDEVGPRVDRSGRRPGGRPDPFTRALLAISGLGTGGLRNRLVVTAPRRAGDTGDLGVLAKGALGRAAGPLPGDRTLTRVHDVGLLRFAGLLGQQHRNAWGLRALLAQYFAVPIEVRQNQAQWLPLAPSSQTRLGTPQNCGLGVNAVAGSRVRDMQGKFRVRLGPLTYQEFLDYLPDRTPTEDRKSFFLLCQLARLYAGLEFDFDVQLVLRPPDVPYCQLSADPVTGPRLGWNCWLLSHTPPRPAEDVVFDGDPVTRVE
jgi:type VI secretion system protein ImpH